MFYTVKAAVLAIHHIMRLPTAEQKRFGLTDADKAWARRMASRWDYTLGNPPWAEISK